MGFFKIGIWGKTERTLLVISFFTLMLTVGSFAYFSNKLSIEEDAINNIEGMFEEYQEGNHSLIQSQEEYNEIYSEYASQSKLFQNNREDIEQNRMIISGAFGLITLCLLSCITIRRPWENG